MNLQADKVMKRWVNPDAEGGRSASPNLNLPHPDVLMSYRTPIAVLDRKAMTCKVSDFNYSATTGGQQWTAKHAAEGAGYTVVYGASELEIRATLKRRGISGYFSWYARAFNDGEVFAAAARYAAEEALDRQDAAKAKAAGRGYWHPGRDKGAAGGPLA